MDDAVGPASAAELRDPWAPLRVHVAQELARRLGARGYPESAENVLRELERAPAGIADLGIALQRPAKSVGVPPERLASDLAQDFPLAGGLARVTAEGPYLNFHSDPGTLIRTTLELVFAYGAHYGGGNPRSESVSVEHTSANPTGPFHIGRVRNGIIGDTLARILRAAGYPVTTQYYVDDMGRQSAMITWIWSKPLEDWPAPIREGAAPPPGASPDTEKPDEWFGRPYRFVSAYLKENPEAAGEVASLVRDIEGGHPPPAHHRIAQAILEGMLATLARVGIGFDEFVWETDLVSQGAVGRVVERLRKAAHALTEENGALAIDGRGYGLPKEGAQIVVTRGDGTSLYPTRDAAFHLNKFARFARVLDVLGQDHQLHARILEALLGELGETRRPEFLIYQDITVPEGGRMSTRKGKAVNLDDLLDEAEDRAKAEVLQRREDLTEAEVQSIARQVAAGAVRYHILRVAPDKPVKFRWEEAMAFDGRSGPFVQYSYARAGSILRKAGRETPPYPFRAEDLATPEEQALVRTLAGLPGTVRYVARTAHVHTLAMYAYELAESFNRFYQSIPVLRSEGDTRDSRIALVAATRQALGNCLGYLGLDRLERM